MSGLNQNHAVSAVISTVQVGFGWQKSGNTSRIKWQYFENKVSVIFQDLSRGFG
jgi:hypothetical protein